MNEYAMPDYEEPRARQGDAHEDGSCNACTRSYPGKVWVIELRSIRIRLCHHCAESLKRQIKS